MVIVVSGMRLSVTTPQGEWSNSLFRLQGSTYWILGDLYLNASLFLPFKYLKSLHLAGNGLVGCFENQGLEVLSSTLRKLELLDLNLNQFNDSTLSCLSGLLSLKSLDLSRTLLTGSSAIKGKSLACSISVSH